MKTTVPSAGATTATTGGWVIVIVIVACPTRPPASVARAVIVCVPGRSAVVPRDAPVPSGPSRLELHAIRLPRSPSSASLAAPRKPTEVPGSALVPDAGPRMVTTGAVFWVSATRSSGLPVDASRLAYRTQSLEVLTRAKLTVPSAVTPGVTSMSTACFALTAPRVPSTGPSTAGRVL